METLAQADIFFFVTTIAVVVIALFIIVACWYFIRFLRDMHTITHLIMEEAAEIIDDIEAFRKGIEGKAKRLNRILGVLTTAQFIRKFVKQVSHTDKDDEEKE